MNLQTILLNFLFFLALIQPLQAQQSSPILQQADSLFAQQAYTEALPLYQQLLEQGQASPAMLLRMAYIREGLGQIPEALYLLNLYYRETSDKEVSTRIRELAGKHNLSGYDVIEEEYLGSLLRRYQLPIVLTLLILCLLLTGLLMYRRFRRQHRPILTPLFVLLLLGALAYFVNFQPDYTKGILMQDNTYLMRGPSAGAGVLTQLKAGHRLEVVGQQDVWLKVVWNDQIAYVKVQFIRTV